MLRRPFGYMRPWREMERLRREMDRAFAGMAVPLAWEVPPSYPAVNVWMSDEGAVVTAELPGVDPKDIDISVRGDTITLTGTRKREEPEEGTYHRRERGTGRFSRTLQLPFHVEANRVEAHFQNGVLRINLPRVEQEKPKKISVKSG